MREFFIYPILDFFKVNHLIINHSVGYVKICALFFLVIGIDSSLIAMLQGLGKTKIIMCSGIIKVFFVLFLYHQEFTWNFVAFAPNFLFCLNFVKSQHIAAVHFSDWEKVARKAPSAVWTYLDNDKKTPKSCLKNAVLHNDFAKNPAEPFLWFSGIFYVFRLFFL